MRVVRWARSPRRQRGGRGRRRDWHTLYYARACATYRLPVAPTVFTPDRMAGASRVEAASVFLGLNSTASRFDDKTRRSLLGIFSDEDCRTIVAGRFFGVPTCAAPGTLPHLSPFAGWSSHDAADRLSLLAGHGDHRRDQAGLPPRRDPARGGLRRSRGHARRRTAAVARHDRAIAGRRASRAGRRRLGVSREPRGTAARLRRAAEPQGGFLPESVHGLSGARRQARLSRVRRVGHSGGRESWRRSSAVAASPVCRFGPCR